MNVFIMKILKYGTFIWISILLSLTASAQLSPGKLASAHAHLEGLSNCTQCHVLGDKVAHDKCLACHKELKTRIILGKGYHSSAEVKNKECSSCHSDHQGLDFKLVKFEKEKFNHALTGYKLQGAHAKKTCADCHKPANIADKSIRSKKFTYLGLGTNCTSCHEDYHQKTLAGQCSDCHNGDAFKPATLFNHNKAAYKLEGSHAKVDCIKCHKLGTREGKKFQEFKGIQFKACTNCHTDPHDDKFGQNCTQCHSTESFKAVKTISNFDHSKTNFKLVDKHLNLKCKDCHKTTVTAALKYQKCSDCHTDYHEQQFRKKGISPDCADCHTTKGFVGSNYTIEKHQASSFPLKGAHEATPCFACHKKQEKWSFRNIGINCIDCHKDAHETVLDKKYYEGSSCENCHSSNSWTGVTFDHKATGFDLTGAHLKQNCRSCHFKADSFGTIVQQFSSLSGNCSDCHTDNHNLQFQVAGVTDCKRCHSTTKWMIDNFDHNTTAYKLDGRHSKVACGKCHNTITNSAKPYILYKLKKSKCEDCH